MAGVGGETHPCIWALKGLAYECLKSHVFERRVYLNQGILKPLVLKAGAIPAESFLKGFLSLPLSYRKLRPPLGQERMAQATEWGLTWDLGGVVALSLLEDGQRLPQEPGHSEEAPTWTPKVSIIMAFWAVFGGFGLLFYMFFGGPGTCVGVRVLQGRPAS